MRFPLVFFEWLWRDVEELPAPDEPANAKAEAEATYRSHLAGRPAELVLTALCDVFTKVQGFLEPRRRSAGEGMQPALATSARTHAPLLIARMGLSGCRVPGSKAGV